MDEATNIEASGAATGLAAHGRGFPPLRLGAVLGYLAIGLLSCVIMGLGEDAVLLILSLVIYTAAAYVIVRNAGGFVITPATLFLLFFTLFTYVGGLSLFFSNGTGVSYGGGTRNYTFFLGIHGGLIFLVLGVLCATMLFAFSPGRERSRFRLQPWRNLYDTWADWIVIGLIAFVAIMVSILYVKSRGTLPLIQVLLARSSENIYELAVTARAEFSRYGRGAGSYTYQGYLQQFYIIVLPLVTLFVASRYFFYRSRKWLALWISVGLISVFFLALSLQRWPLMFFIVMNYVLYASYTGRVRLMHGLAFSALAIALFGLLTYIRGYEDLAVALYWVQNRIFITNVDVLYSIFEMFPEHFSFLGGQGVLSDIQGALPGPGLAFTRWLYGALYQVYGSGSAPTIFLGELYADFGLPGVLAGSLVVGFIMQWIYIDHLRREKELLNLVLYVVLIMAAAELALTNPVTVLLQFGVVAAFLFLLILKIFRWPLQATPLAWARHHGG